MLLKCDIHKVKMFITRIYEELNSTHYKHSWWPGSMCHAEGSQRVLCLPVVESCTFWKNSWLSENH